MDKVDKYIQEAKILNVLSSINNISNMSAYYNVFLNKLFNENSISDSIACQLLIKAGINVKLAKKIVIDYHDTIDIEHRLSFYTDKKSPKNRCKGCIFDNLRCDECGQPIDCDNFVDNCNGVIFKWKKK